MIAPESQKLIHIFDEMSFFKFWVCSSVRIFHDFYLKYYDLQILNYNITIVSGIEHQIYCTLHLQTLLFHRQLFSSNLSLFLIGQLVSQYLQIIQLHALSTFPKTTLSGSILYWQWALKMYRQLIGERRDQTPLAPAGCT